MRQTLTLYGNLLAGYDDNLTARLGTGTGVTPTAMTSGYTGSLDGTVDYLRGNSRHELRIGSTGSLIGYPGYIDTPAAGITATVDGKAAAGRRLTITGGGRVGYEPFFNAFSAGVGTPLPPGSAAATPVAGLFERRSLSSTARTSLETRIGRRDSSSFSYRFAVQSVVDDEPEGNGVPSFAGRNSTSHNAGAGYKRIISAGVRARADYQFSEFTYGGSTGSMSPTRTQRVEGGADVEHAVERGDRLVTWTVMAGAAHVEAFGSSGAGRRPYAIWLPVASARVQVPFATTGVFDGTYRREFNLLQGITDKVYATDTVAVSTGFGVAPRTDLRLIGSFATWTTPTPLGVSDTFEVYGAGAQLRVFITNAVGVTGVYYYYHHRYSNAAGLPEGFPATYNRNAFRLGLTFILPVVSPPSARAGRP